MKITCKQCGIVLTVDAQDAELHPGLCDVCINTVPATVEFVQDNQPNIETQMEPQETQEPIAPEEVVESIEEEVIAEEAEALMEEIALPQSAGEVLEVPEEQKEEQPEEVPVTEEVPVVEPTPVQE